LEFTKDGDRLVSSSFDVDSPLVVWRIATGTLERRLPGHRDFICSVALSADDRIVASAAARLDGTVRLWDLELDREVLRLPGHNGEVAIVRFSPNGDFLVTRGRDFTVHVWDVLSD
jgi:WD40 repeat protein